MNKLAPKYGRATGPTSLSIAAVSNASGFRVDGKFRQCADLGSFRWETADDFNHDYLKYPAQQDFTNVTLAFRYSCTPSHKPLDSSQAPSLTIRANGADYEVRLLNYATRVSGANTQASGTVTVSIPGDPPEDGEQVVVRIGLLSGISGCTPAYNYTDFTHTTSAGQTADEIASALADLLDASTEIAASAAGGVVTITAREEKHPGIDGNGIQLQAESSAHVTLNPSGSKLAGGVSAGAWDVTIPFNTVKAGFDNSIEIPETQIERLLFNFVSQNYQNFPDTLLPDDFAVEFLNWSVSGAGAFLFNEPAALRSFPRLGVAVGYDDEGDKTLEWVVYNIQQLGFRGLVNVYVGAQKFYDKTEDAGQPSGWKADTTKTWNTAADAWLTDLLARLAAAGYKTVFSYSLELFDPDATWTQRDSLGNHATTAFGYLLSPADPAVLAWQKALYLKLASEMSTAGLEINLLFGEFWWWWRPQNNAPCFYDQDTKDQYAAEHGGAPIPEYTDKATVSYSQAVAEWLRDKLGAFSLSIRDYVQGTYPAAKFGPLYFPTSVEPYPLMAIVNLPVNHWKQSEVDFFISETYDWVMAEPLKFRDSQAAMVRPINDPALAFSRANVWHLSGFVDTAAYAGGTLVQWAKVVQNTRMAYAWKRLGQVATWSIRQVIRDNWQPDGAIYQPGFSRRMMPR